MNNILDQPDAPECAGAEGIAKVAVLDQWPVLRLNRANIEKHVLRLFVSSDSPPWQSILRYRPRSR
ncbi:hypothetical protein [Mesorhizobium sp. M00.F.Ca.ET.216.01.1.1]|uniref:hypothetical protein n=1 Tax=Mesorhizobium sp. M00.F.Ca.ET.216.01.1.1 TaxID=2500528 RepID=UPI000FE01F41|nr:hypothetical protein [Mesorhizobium sp. M00.F.Ca.ET.216.01.1.1]TGQ41172.1 hypothetical protein EN859_012530 [Mesorhizobium sp. M00.F.Ca.ET.216.01.1.1]